MSDDPLELDDERKIAILTTAVCALLEEHRPKNMSVGVATGDGFGYIVEYDAEKKQILISDCGCSGCAEARARAEAN